MAPCAGERWGTCEKIRAKSDNSSFGDPTSLSSSRGSRSRRRTSGAVRDRESGYTMRGWRWHKTALLVGLRCRLNADGTPPQLSSAYAPVAQRVEMVSLNRSAIRALSCWPCGMFL
eukprot:5002332-Pleurochrysis_carterae.AAC.1